MKVFWLCTLLAVAAGAHVARVGAVRQPAPPSCDTTAAQQASIVEGAVAKLQAANWTLVRSGSLTFTSMTGVGSDQDSVRGLFSFAGYPAGAFPMSEQDVVMWVGCTPPPAAYFSWSHLVLQKQPGFHTVWADSGDSINMLVANSTVNGGASFNSTAALLVTADAASADAARLAFGGAGLAPSAVNTLLVPSALVGRMGPTASDDLMQVMFRVALFDSTAQAAPYTGATWPVAVYAPPAATPQSPAPTSALRSRPGSIAESKYASSLALLRGNVTSRLELLGFQLQSTTQLQATNHSEGRACLAANTFCAGGTRDAVYGATGPEFTLGAGDDALVVVVGVDHVAAGVATFSNIAVDSLGVSGVTGVGNAQFNGSAAFFAPHLPSAPDLFAYAIARNCSQLMPYCVTVSTSDLPASVPFSVVSRAFVNPETKVGPDPEQVVLASVLSFAGAGAPSAFA